MRRSTSPGEKGSRKGVRESRRARAPVPGCGVPLARQAQTAAAPASSAPSADICAPTSEPRHCAAPRANTVSESGAPPDAEKMAAPSESARTAGSGAVTKVVYAEDRAALAPRGWPSASTATPPPPPRGPPAGVTLSAYRVAGAKGAWMRRTPGAGRERSRGSGGSRASAARSPARPAASSARPWRSQRSRRRNWGRSARYACAAGGSSCWRKGNSKGAGPESTAREAARTGPWEGWHTAPAGSSRS
mmetsp:Transcript_27328/g.80397  ORF Transcript_27328/g.80397 Transcript_27328/m.80397 type:complete len:247 (-) Transcript_27328:144-884(-)